MAAETRSIDLARSAFPELGGALDEELEEWAGGPIPSHNVIGMVVNPHLKSLLTRGEPSDVTRVMQYLEEIAGHPDRDTRNVAEVTVIPYVWSYVPERTLARILPYAGDATRHVVKHLRDVD